MLTIATDQVLLTDNSWAVCVGGDYAPDALVECYRLSDPEQKVSYYASYIVNGEYPQ